MNNDFVKIRPPGALGEAVREICVSNGWGVSGDARRERSLPSGEMRIVFRLTGGPLTVFDSEDGERAETFAPAVVGGPRTTPVVKRLDESSTTVCAVIRPGRASMLFGDAVDDFAGRFVNLEDMWGRAVGETHERLLADLSDAGRIAIFRDFLAARLRDGSRPNPLVDAAVADEDSPVGAFVAESGLSHRRFIELFRRHVGLAPKEFRRVRRFSSVVKEVASTDAPLAEIAFQAGYSDQAHFSRDFREFAGVTPAALRRAAPAHSHHLPIVNR